MPPAGAGLAGGNRFRAQVRVCIYMCGLAGLWVNFGFGWVDVCTCMLICMWIVVCICFVDSDGCINDNGIINPIHPSKMLQVEFVEKPRQLLVLGGMMAGTHTHVYH